MTFNSIDYFIPYGCGHGIVVSFVAFLSSNISRVWCSFYLLRAMGCAGSQHWKCYLFERKREKRIFSFIQFPPDVQLTVVREPLQKLLTENGAYKSSPLACSTWIYLVQIIWAIKQNKNGDLWWIEGRSKWKSRAKYNRFLH